MFEQVRCCFCKQFSNIDKDVSYKLRRELEWQGVIEGTRSSSSKAIKCSNCGEPISIQWKQDISIDEYFEARIPTEEDLMSIERETMLSREKKGQLNLLKLTPILGG
jgi:hypothetical protein